MDESALFTAPRYRAVREAHSRQPCTGAGDRAASSWTPRLRNSVGTIHHDPVEEERAMAGAVSAFPVRAGVKRALAPVVGL